MNVSSFKTKMMEYMLYTDPNKLVGMPNLMNEEHHELGHTLDRLFKTGILKRMWIDRNTNQVMVSE